jgi:hypothetical protein
MERATAHIAALSAFFAKGRFACLSGMDEIVIPYFSR